MHAFVKHWLSYNLLVLITDFPFFEYSVHRCRASIHRHVDIIPGLLQAYLVE